MLWNDIENRVLKVYQHWWRKFQKEEAKYFHIIDKYKDLRRKIGMPEEPDPADDRPPEMPVPKPHQQAPELPPAVTPEELALIDNLIETARTAFQKNELSGVLNNEFVRRAKAKSSQLYTVFQSKGLDEQTKERIKAQYSELRSILKKLDAANEQLKLQKERAFVEQTVSKAIVKPLSQKNIESPSKLRVEEEDLLQQAVPTSSPSRQESVL